MEAPEDVMGSPSSSSTGDHSPPHPALLKRKRSKRPPPPRPPPIAASSSSSSSADYLSSTTEEEEDMAHCLILLAQGGALVDSPPPPPPAEKFTSRRFTEATTTAGGKAGFYVYECKTCNKCFPSFQALGGHRASHKKSKMAILTLTTGCEDKNLTMNDKIVEGVSANTFSKPASAVDVPAANSPTNNKMRVHECSICGAEFSSGQALGGHMRRHRPIGAGPESSPSPTQEVVVLKKERNMLSLDLNLPAPADENPPPPPVVAAFSFADKRPMVFSATSAAALVDCHY